MDRIAIRKRVTGPDRTVNPPSVVANNKTGESAECILVDIWCYLLGLDSLGIHANVFAAGGDSLLAVRMCAEVETRLGVKLEPEVIFRAPTVAKLADVIRSNAVTPDELLHPLHTEGNQIPIFFAQPGRGWYDLHVACGLDRPIYGVKPFWGDRQVASDATIERLVAEYAREIREMVGNGPVAIAGFSLGAVIAFELAQQLTRAGTDVALLHLLDPLVPRSALYNRSFWQQLNDGGSRFLARMGDKTRGQKWAENRSTH